MKKTIISCLALICAVCACNKQIEVQEPAEKPVQKQIITARVNVDSKVAYVENENDGTTFHGLSSTWEEGDKFLAIKDGETVVEFNLVSGAGENEAVFQAEAENVTETTSWVAVLGNNAKAASTEIHCSYLNQNGTLAGLADCNYVKAEGEGLEPVFDFNGGEKLSFILRIKLPAGVKSMEYNPCAWYKVTEEETTEQLYSSGNSDKEPDYKAFDKDHTTTIILGSASSTGDCVYIAVPALNCNLGYESYNNAKQYGNLRTGFVLTFLNEDSDNADLSNGIVLGGDKDSDFNLTGKGGKIGTIDCSGLTLINRPRPSEAVKIVSGVTNQDISTTKEYVNGLETYWAPFNVGASSVAESGYYVGYGEMNERFQGDFVSYTLRQKGSDGTNRPAVISYTHAAFPGSGATTFFTIAGTRYDIARVKWGIAWRMPYAVECGTLWKNHKSSLSAETVSGRKCFKIDNGSGQNVYIPCCGWYGDEKNDIKDSGYACIWSSDKNQRSASNAGWDQAYAIQFSATTQSDDFLGRYGMHRTLNVRPVLASSVIQ